MNDYSAHTLITHLQQQFLLAYLNGRIKKDYTITWSIEAKPHESCTIIDIYRRGTKERSHRVKSFAWLMVGIFNASEDERTGAINSYHRSIVNYKIDPSDTIEIFRISSEIVEFIYYGSAWFDLGRVLHNAGILECSIEAYREALKYNDFRENSEKDDVMFNLGCALDDLQRYRDAEMVYRNVKGERRIYALKRLVACLCKQCDYYEALRECLNALIKQDNFYKEMGHYFPDTEAVRNAYSKLVRDSRHTNIIGKGWHLLGCHFRSIGCLDMAVEAFYVALKDESKNERWVVFRDLGEALNKIGKHQEAIGAYRTALQYKYIARHNRASILYDLGCILMQLDKDDEAFNTFLKAEILGMQGCRFYELGRKWHHNCEYGKAIRAYYQVLGRYDLNTKLTYINIIDNMANALNEMPKELNPRVRKTLSKAWFKIGCLYNNYYGAKKRGNDPALNAFKMALSSSSRKDMEVMAFEISNILNKEK